MKMAQLNRAVRSYRLQMGGGEGEADQARKKEERSSREGNYHGAVGKWVYLGPENHMVM